MYKNNSRNSSKPKGCSPPQLSCNLTGKCTLSATIIILSVVGHFVKTNDYFYFIADTQGKGDKPSGVIIMKTSIKKSIVL